MAFLGPVDFPAILTIVKNLITNIIETIKTTGRQMMQRSTMMKTFGIFTVLFSIGKCLFTFFDLIFGLLQWAWLFILWFPGEFIPWFIQFVNCALQKLFVLPKCFLWYGLDTVGWAIYLPFRFLFWGLTELLFEREKNVKPDDPNDDNRGLVKIERDIWCFLEDVDHFLYDPAEQGGMGLGFHIIHFPDSVMETCYKCKTGVYKPGPSFPIDKVTKFMKCITAPF